MADMQDADPYQTSESVLPFRRVYNFRDVGGYSGTGGRRVRRRSLYRSGHLNKVNRYDLRLFASLGIHAVVDFRSVEERQKEPDRFPRTSIPNIVELPMLDETNSVLVRDVKERIRDNRFDDFDIDTLMQTTYQQFVTDFSDEFGRFIKVLLEAEGKPVLWHCSGGKDRTGFASAILLELLGVDSETIVADYLLSNRYADRGRRALAVLRFLRGREAADAIRALYTVRESWIRAARRAIDQEYGNFKAYRKEALGLTDADVERLGSSYLE